MDSNDKYVGRILDNRYEILELIGAGGMALVYKARCHRLNRMVAIKILKEDLAGDQEFKGRFYTESQAVAMLSHPNIVAVYDVSRSGSVEYIVMELIEGITLKQYINRKGLLNWKEALHFATQITKALGHAHSRGIIHRDIKPHNIIILRDGSVKVADFGIARLLTMDNTLTQEALGSVHYISPEQAKGGQIDARSDIYSVGVVMYEMLTSRLPFVGDSAVSVAIQHISAIPLMPREINPDVPIGLEDITMRAMEPDLNMRFTTADEMLYNLEEFRKNPAIVFKYAKSDLNAVPQPERFNEYDTKVVPKDYDYRAETGVAPPRPEQRYPVAQQQHNLKKPELTRDEHRVVKTRASNTATLVGVGATVVFLLIVAVFMWNFFLADLFNPQSRETATIPNFYNLEYDDIVRDIQYRDLFTFTKIEETSDEVPEGRVIRQNPSADREMSFPLSGDPISIQLFVSTGTEPLTPMPDLVGLHFSSARNQLNRLNMNLRVEEEIVASDEIDQGYVVETRPHDGDGLSRNDTVLIILSGGPNVRFEVVPDMVNRQFSILEEAFSDLDFTADVTYLPDSSEEGTVLYIQRVGESIAVPATLIVHVSSGPETREETVPNLIGSSITELQGVFASLELTADIEYQENPSPEGTVINIDRIGERVAVPETITVYVSSGPPQEEEPPDDSPPGGDAYEDFWHIVNPPGPGD